MTTRLLDIFNASGDENLGQTLLRLARLAESAHRFEVHRRVAESCREEQEQGGGRALGRLVQPDAGTDAGQPGSARTEVSR